MKNLFITACAILITVSLSGQEFKLAKSSGKLVIKDVNKVNIEGHAGNEIIFSSMDGSQGRDTRAVGLRAISNQGLEDNTGIGLAVLDKGTTYEVYQMKKMEGPRVKIMVPKGVSVSYSHSSPYGSDITFKNVEGEIETSTVHNGVHLENVTGPMTIKTVHGEIEADFSNGMKSPITLSSQHGLIDITIPAATKATMSMKTSYGEILVDPVLKLEVEKVGDFVKYSSNKVEGKLNGGGIEINLSSNHNNIYLRKK